MFLSNTVKSAPPFRLIPKDIRFLDFVYMHIDIIIYVSSRIGGYIMFNIFIEKTSPFNFLAERQDNLTQSFKQKLSSMYCITC